MLATILECLYHTHNGSGKRGLPLQTGPLRGGWSVYAIAMDPGV